MKPAWKIFTALTGIFIAGAVTGFFANPPLMHKFAAKPAAPEQLKRYAEQLDLTVEQQAKIQTILKQTAEDVRNTRRDAFKATAAIFERRDAAIAAELTAEQRTRFVQMQAKERERRKQWLAERAKQHAENRPSGGPDGDDAHHGPPPPPPSESAPPDTSASAAPKAAP